MQILKESFPYITNLSIVHSKTGNKLIKDIVNSKISDHLEVLSLWGNQICSIDPLLDACFLHLEELDLSDNDLYDSGVESLAACNFPKLKELSLQETKISGKGLKLLSQAEGFPKIKKIHLGRNPEINKEDIEDFLKSNFAKKLTFLDVHVSSLTKEDKQHIQKKLPNLKKVH